MKTDKSFTTGSFFFIIICLLFSCTAVLGKPPKKILVFSKTAKFRHTEGIRAGKAALLKMGLENNFAVDTTEDASVFTVENLKQYSAVIFLSTTGDALNDEQQAAFEQYIHSRKGFVGIHSATDTEYDWPWYGNLVGAYFKSHPPGQQEAILNIINSNNIATRHLPRPWKKKDELYNFKWIKEGLHVIIMIDENSYNGGENGNFHPISWYQEYEGSHAFYTALGHDDKSFADPLYLKHLLGGIQYALGMKPGAMLK